MKSSARNPEPRVRSAPKGEVIGMEIKDNGLSNTTIQNGIKNPGPTRGIGPGTE
jgi:hypothetical protein